MRIDEGIDFLGLAALSGVIIEGYLGLALYSILLPQEELGPLEGLE